jgi:HAD superfamily hydrolase (TIGR01509 family)
VSEFCVIFDLDGTLVDSERQSSQAFLDLLPELDEPVDALVRRYRGMRLAPVLADIEARLGRKLPEEFTPSYRRRVAELFDRELEPMPGAEQLLRSLSVPFCIASAGPPEKIRHSLGRTGLAPRFGERVFSSYVVGSWKPEPGLFLHAANALGFSPEQCIVVEDSDPGLIAAQAAGMRSIHFAPDHIASSIACHARVASLLEIPRLLRLFEQEIHAPAS